METPHKTLRERVSPILRKYESTGVRDPHLNWVLNSLGGPALDPQAVLAALVSDKPDAELRQEFSQHILIDLNDVDRLLDARAAYREETRLAEQERQRLASLPPPLQKRSWDEAGKKALLERVTQILTFAPNPGYAVDPYACPDPAVHQKVFQLLLSDLDDDHLWSPLRSANISTSKFEALFTARRETARELRRPPAKPPPSTPPDKRP